MRAIDCIKNLTYALDAKDLSDAELKELIGAWVKYSPEEVSEAKEYLNSAIFSKNRGNFLVASLLAVGVLCCFVFLLKMSDSLALGLALGVGGYSSLVALYNLAGAVEEGVIKPVLAREGLRRAAELPSEHCAQALIHVQAYPELRAYRDALVDNGRELRALDLKYISHRAWRLAWAARQKELALTAQKACRALHGLPD